MAEIKEILKDPVQSLYKSSVPALTGESIMPIGSHQGKRLVDMPRSFFEWFVQDIYRTGKGLYSGNIRDQIRIYSEETLGIKYQRK
jgi:uncharacterized protein (DUF3820 family)